MPTFRMEDVRARDGKGKDGAVWVVYKRGVYDVTDFVASHPGGSKILLAAGGSVAPYWKIYAVHNSEFVQEVLAELRIGNLEEEDAKALEEAATAASTGSGDGPFAHEPARLPVLDVRSELPYNAETPAEVLGDTFVTPSDLFYVRNHLAVPAAEAEARVTVAVEGLGSGEGRGGGDGEGGGVRGAPAVSFSIADLGQRFRQHEVTAVLQCGGNRRVDMSAHRAVHGLRWNRGAIGNAVWRGPLARDVLLAAGVTDADVEAAEQQGEELHLVMEGRDRDEEGKSYGASIPLWRAMSKDHEVVLALEMNGEPLPTDHGAPVRVVVPGVVGARSVKWLGQMRVSKQPSDSFWQRQDYKALGPGTDWEKINWDEAHTIEEMPVQSSILTPLPKGDATSVELEGSTDDEDGDEDGNEDDDDGVVDVSGYAWGGGGRGVARVDVSGDGGQTWVEATLRDVPVRQREGKKWAWVLWDAEVRVPKQGGELVSRAVDSACNVQPEHVGPQWSPRGLLANSWSRVPVERR